jgi:hypothetical protein
MAKAVLLRRSSGFGLDDSLVLRQQRVGPSQLFVPRGLVGWRPSYLTLVVALRQQPVRQAPEMLRGRRRSPVLGGQIWFLRIGGGLGVVLAQAARRGCAV